MSKEIASPLADIVSRLASKNIQGPAAKLKERFVRASDVVVVLADCSGSMWDLTGFRGMSKYQHLEVALKDVVRAFPAIRLVAFNSTARVISDPSQLPKPSGGTDLTGALKLAAGWKPRKTIIISDGVPDDESSAFDEARRMTGAIDTIYCGPDQHEACAFLQSLSKECGGVSHVWTGTSEIGGNQPKELGCVIRGLLG